MLNCIFLNSGISLISTYTTFRYAVMLSDDFIGSLICDYRSNLRMS